ncbi:MAG: cell division protein FtsL [Spirochaetaceae bacterium]
MKRYLVIACILSVPIALFVNVWQSYRYESLQRETVRLERAQEEAIERNKRLIAGIAVLRSPARIQDLAESELELERSVPARTVFVRVRSGGEHGEVGAP